jgi:hypothetical protein
MNNVDCDELLKHGIMITESALKQQFLIFE